MLSYAEVLSRERKVGKSVAIVGAGESLSPSKAAKIHFSFRRDRLFSVGRETIVLLKRMLSSVGILNHLEGCACQSAYEVKMVMEGCSLLFA